MPPRLRIPIILSALALTGILQPAAAMEGGQSPYFKGYRDFMTGVLPSQGVQLREDIFLYNGTERSTVPQGQLTIGGKSVTSVLSATLITPYHFLGGDYAFAVRGAFGNISANQSVATPRGDSSASGRLAAFNDIVVTPFILGWHSGYFHWNVSTSVWLPAGSYDRNRTANTGRNIWGFSPQLGVTYLNPTTGWDLSAAAIFVTTSQNPATNYYSGNIAHFDFAFGKILSPQFKVGVVGYYAQQITDDSGTGAIAGPRRLRVVGLGPGASYSFAMNEVPVTLVAKYFREFDAQNTTQGDTGILSARVKF